MDHFIFETICQSQGERIRNTKLGEIFDKTLLAIGEDPNKIWNKATSK